MSTSYTRCAITPDKLAHIWANLWERGKQEFAALGISLSLGFAMFLDYKAAESFILLADDEPVLVCGIVRLDDGDSFTFMQATTAFDKHYREIMRVMRRGSRRHGGNIYIYSPLIHDKAARFFQAIGYERDDWSGKSSTGRQISRFRRV